MDALKPLGGLSRSVRQVVRPGRRDHRPGGDPHRRQRAAVRDALLHRWVEPEHPASVIRRTTYPTIPRVFFFFFCSDGSLLAIGSHDNFIYLYTVSERGRKYSRYGKCSVSPLLVSSPSLKKKKKKRGINLSPPDVSADERGPHRDIPATSHTWTGHLTTTSSCPTPETMRSSTVSTGPAAATPPAGVGGCAVGDSCPFPGDVPNGCNLIRNRSECKDIDWATYTCVLGYHVFG